MPKGVYERTAEHRAAIKRAHAGLLGHPQSAETRAKIGHANHIALTGKTLSEAHRARIRTSMMGKRNGLGYKHTEAAKVKIGIAARESIKRHDPNCRCGVHSPWAGQLTWLLAEALNKLGFAVQPEARLGRWSVDALLVDEWIAFEADSGYWHNLPKVKQRDVIRDKELLETWDLPTVRLTEREVHALVDEIHKEDEP